VHPSISAWVAQNRHEDMAMMAIAAVLIDHGSQSQGWCAVNYIGLFDMSIVIKATTDLGRVRQVSPIKAGGVTRAFLKR